MNIVIALLILVVVLAIGAPISVAFFSATIYLIFWGGYDASFLIPYGFSKLNSIILLIIPLFIMAGSLMNYGGVGEKLTNAVDKLVGRVKGGLGVVSIVTCGVFGAISGSAFATLSAIGSIMSPRLQEQGYSRGFTGALLSSAGVLGTMIPPSGIMILYAWVANQSVLKCFLAGVGPGLLMIIFLSIINFVYAKTNPNIKVVTKQEYLEHKASIPKHDANGKRNWGSIPALLMPVIILGGIYSGIFTPTEAAAVSVVYAIPVGLYIYRKINKDIFKKSILEAGTTTGAIMAMLFSVMILSRIFIMENMPQRVLEMLTSITPNPKLILLLINVFLIIIGMLMDDCSGIVLAAPILLPIVTQIGVDPVQFAAILCVNLGMGNITPPTAPMLYLSGRVCKAPVKEMLPYAFICIFCAWIPTLILTMFIPQVSLFLPSLL